MADDEYTPLDPSLSYDEMVTRLSEGVEEARLILDSIGAADVGVTQLMLDLDDMRIRGKQLVSAYNFCNRHPDQFIAACSRRDPQMVNFVNEGEVRRFARRHGPQRTVSPVDHAVSAAMKAAGPQATLERADEGSEYVHAFFMRMIEIMRVHQKFVTNFHLNTGTEGITAVFGIHLVELLKDGKPYRPEDPKPTTSSETE